MKTEITPRNWVQPLFVLYFLLFTIFLFMQAINHPTNNWDMLGYAGSVKSFETDDKKEIHDFVFSELEKYVDAETFQDLTSGSEYRKIVYADPESFRQVLPWYQIRPIYTGAIYVLTKFSVNIFHASALVSASAVFVGLWIFYLAFRPYVANSFWFALPFFIVLNDAVKIASYSSPDSLAFLWVGILSYFFIRRHRLFLWILPLSIIVRTDLIFMVGLFLAYLFWFYSVEQRKTLKVRKGFSLIKTQRGKVVLASVASLAIYFAINTIFGNYGWATVFHLMFVSRLNYPADIVVHIDFMQYFNAVVYGLPGMLQNNAFDLFVGIFIVMIGVLINLKQYGGKLKHILAGRLNALMVISFLFIVAHYLVFPEDDSRFFVAQYMISLLCFLALLTRINGLEPTQEQKIRRHYIK